MRIKARMKTSLAGVGALALAGAMVVGPAQGVLAERLAAPGISPAQGHAQVVAQQVATFGATEYSWSIKEQLIEKSGTPISSAGAGFLVGNLGTALIANETGDELRLAQGEAMPLRQERAYTAVAEGGEPAAAFQIALQEGSSGDDLLFSGEAFDGLAGKHDLDLVRDVLTPAETSEIPDGEGPTMLLVTEGKLSVRAEGEELGVVLQAGDAAEFDGALELRAGGNEESAFVAALIGPELSAGSESGSGSDGPSGGSGSGSGQGGGAGDTGPAPTPTPAVDSDNDGLYDHEEIALGTDPNNPDSDQDGLTDGDEVKVYGSNPLSMDTDGDMLPDYNEVMQHGTDPTYYDTDNDGVSDHDELNYATSPINPDTDGDGLMDGLELYTYASDPNNPDSDQDGLTDGDEVNSWGSSPTSMDTDGDLLPDYNEVMQHGTNPANADTDGDGVSDHDEINNGTDPLDPNDSPQN